MILNTYNIQYLQPSLVSDGRRDYLQPLCRIYISAKNQNTQNMFRLVPTSTTDDRLQMTDDRGLRYIPSYSRTL